MTNTYFIPIDSNDVQDAISVELGINVEEYIAQEVLDNFIQEAEVVATVGCSSQEECLSMMLCLMKQIGEHKEQIIQCINETDAA